jgi:hypothetical protein
LKRESKFTDIVMLGLATIIVLNIVGANLSGVLVFISVIAAPSNGRLPEGMPAKGLLSCPPPGAPGRPPWRVSGYFHS